MSPEAAVAEQIFLQEKSALNEAGNGFDSSRSLQLLNNIPMDSICGSLFHSEV